MIPVSLWSFNDGGW